MAAMQSPDQREIVAVINAGLATVQRQQIGEVMGCAGSDGAGSGMDGHTTSTPYLSADHVSFRIDAAWYCAGAAHPDFSTQGFTFDAGTGAALTLEDLVWPPGHDAPAPQSDAWYGWRSNVLAPRLVALLRRFHPQELVSPANAEDECDYSDPQVWSFPAWYLSAQGLHVGATFPRVIRVCDNPDWAIIPLSALDQPQPTD